jgi:hypothetical protein
VTHDRTHLARLDDAGERRHVRAAAQGGDLPGHRRQGRAGYRGIRLLRRALDGEVEFITLMWFDSWEAVKAFAGEDHEHAVVPPKARAVLARFDDRSQHYEVRESSEYRG